MDDLADQALTGPRSASADLAAVRRVPLDTADVGARPDAN
jgi:hypothetical protein